MGMNEWLGPQISEHCPKNKPVRSAKKLISFKRPGQQSALTPREGIVQEWRTSIEVTSKRTGASTGRTRELVVSKRRKDSEWDDLDLIIYLR